MCFSATGSFAVSGILAGVATASLLQIRERSFRMLALMPLLFAIQQATEGVVWLTVASGQQTALHQVAVYAFLAFALVVWPSWLPWSLLLIERRPARRRWLVLLACAGGLMSAYGAWLLLSWRPHAYVGGHSLQYDYPVSDGLAAQVALLLLYTVPTVGAFFASTIRMARPMGAVLLIGLAAALVIKRGALTSVWCFFAAVLSVLFVIAVVREQTDREQGRPALAGG